MRKFGTAAAILAALSGPALAQLGSKPEKDLTALHYEKQEIERADNEKAYNAQMKRLKAQAPAEGKKDPWAGVRSGETKR